LTSCFACEAIAGRVEVPGGVIAETAAWVVDHCVGPLGVGTLIVKPRRHVLSLGELEPQEGTELGPLLASAARVVRELLQPEQVYVCLWSHAGGKPVHIHFVVQPITSALLREHGLHGPALQAAMFEAGEQPTPDDIATFAESARPLFRAA
jgi:diadenosine tetraphosphate (Ap4A) HIT family hydrolase